MVQYLLFVVNSNKMEDMFCTRVNGVIGMQCFISGSHDNSSHYGNKIIKIYLNQIDILAFNFIELLI